MSQLFSLVYFKNQLDFFLNNDCIQIINEYLDITTENTLTKSIMEYTLKAILKKQYYFQLYPFEEFKENNKFLDKTRENEDRFIETLLKYIHNMVFFNSTGIMFTTPYYYIWCIQYIFNDLISPEYYKLILTKFDKIKEIILPYHKKIQNINDMINSFDLAKKKYNPIWKTKIDEILNLTDCLKYEEQIKTYGLCKSMINEEQIKTYGLCKSMINIDSLKHRFIGDNLLEQFYKFRSYEINKDFKKIHNDRIEIETIFQTKPIEKLCTSIEFDFDFDFEKSWKVPKYTFLDEIVDKLHKLDSYIFQYNTKIYDDLQKEEFVISKIHKLGNISKENKIKYENFIMHYDKIWHIIIRMHYIELTRLTRQVRKIYWGSNGDEIEKCPAEIN